MELLLLLRFLGGILGPEKETSSPARRSPSLLGLLGILASLITALRFFSKGKVHPRNQPTYPRDNTTDRCKYVPAIIVNSETNAITTSTSKNEANRREASNWEKAVTIAQVIIAFVTLGLLIVNFFQMRSTRLAANAAKESADLSRSVLAGTDAARIDIVRINPQEADPDGFTMIVGNPGKLATQQLYGRFDVTLISLPTNRAIETFTPIIFGPAVLFPISPHSDEREENISQYPFRIPTFQKHKLSVERLQETFMVKGIFTYDNAFGETVNKTGCQQIVPQLSQRTGPPPSTIIFYTWTECGMVPDLVSIYKNALKNRN